MVQNFLKNRCGLPLLRSMYLSHKPLKLYQPDLLRTSVVLWCENQWNRMITTPTPHIMVILKATKITLIRRNGPEALNFTTSTILIGSKLMGVKIKQWIWHRPLSGEILYIGNCYTNFNKILYITFLWHYTVSHNGRNRNPNTPNSHMLQL